MSHPAIMHVYYYVSPSETMYDKLIMYIDKQAETQSLSSIPLHAQ